MAFSIQTAIDRITNQPEQTWTPGMSDSAKLQRINEILDAFWTQGAFEGLFADVDLTCTGGIITLPAQYRLLTSIGIPALGVSFIPKSQLWKFTASAPPLQDWTQYSGDDWLAFDQGEIVTGARRLTVTGTTDFAGTYTQNGSYNGNPIYQQDTDEFEAHFWNDGTQWVFSEVIGGDAVDFPYWLSPTLSGSYTPHGTTDTATVAVTESDTSQRRYQIAGDPTSLDGLTYIGQAKKRYTYATDTSALVLPDNFEALLSGVRAYHWRDVGDNSRFEKEFGTSLAVLSKDLADVQEGEDLGYVALEPCFHIPNLM